MAHSNMPKMLCSSLIVLGSTTCSHFFKLLSVCMCANQHPNLAPLPVHTKINTCEGSPGTLPQLFGVTVSLNPPTPRASFGQEPLHCPGKQHCPWMDPLNGSCPLYIRSELGHLKTPQPFTSRHRGHPTSLSRDTVLFALLQVC